MKIIIAPDSFKGSLTAKEASNAIAKGILAVLPNTQIDKIPVGDGGEGTVDSLVFSTKGQFIKTSALDPLNRKIDAQYGILGNKKTAIIEMATASGITLLKKNERNPLLTSTYGTGQLIKQALDVGYRKFIICIGGSATNDCGTGMAQALGVKFFTKNNIEISKNMCGNLLHDVAFIDSSNIHPGVKESEFLIASDVNNPLLGELGCANIYAPQKGATAEIVDKLESNMRSFIEVSENHYNIAVRDVPGAGAAGGLGAGLMLFINGKLKSGIDIVLNACNFKKRIINADLIITGEGKIDGQTMYGKTISGVARHANKQKIPVIAFAGIIENVEKLKGLGISSFYSLKSNGMTIDQSIANASTLLQDTVEDVIRTFDISNLNHFSN